MRHTRDMAYPHHIHLRDTARLAQINTWVTYADPAPGN
jgi:hypothetical protein